MYLTEIYFKVPILIPNIRVGLNPSQIDVGYQDEGGLSKPKNI